VIEAAPQTRSGSALILSSGAATGDHGGQARPQPFPLIIGGCLKIGCYRISTVTLNFVLERLTIRDRPVGAGGGWQIHWDTVGNFATLGGACGRMLREKIVEPARGDADRLLSLERKIEAAIKQINADCTAANKSIYTLKRPKNGTKRGENEHQPAAQ